MTTFFFTGIDTGIGKTITAGLAARYLLKHGKKVLTQKLVQTGQNVGSCSEDILEHRRLMRTGLLPEDSEPISKSAGGTLTCPYSFPYPASPHLAADLEKQTINIDTLTAAAKTLKKRCDILLIEGVGGAMVPLTPNFFTADYIAQRRYPVILTTSTRLGSISHTLLTLEALRHRKIPLACLAVNLYPQTDNLLAEDTIRFFRRTCSSVITLPLFNGNDDADADFSCLLYPP